MAKDKQLWQWYQHHNQIIDVLLDMACDMVPGGKLVLGLLRTAHAVVEDREQHGVESRMDQLEQNQVSQAEQLLTDLQPVVSQVVEDIADLESITVTASPNQIREAITASQIKPAVNAVLPRIQEQISRSINQAIWVINDKYRVERRIAGGGQGEVYLATNLSADSPVAIKLFPLQMSNATALATLRDEFQRVKQLVHPHIVQYRDIDQDRTNGQLFVVMDFVAGDNLRHLLVARRQQPLSISETISLLTPVADALDCAHRQQVAHCDLKPDNILIRTSDRHIFLTDFGLAQKIHSTVSRQNRTNTAISGTYAYMAPEQYRGQLPDRRTDIWALGIVAYEMLAGGLPFHAATFEHYKSAICEEQPRRPPGITDHVWQAISAALQKDPKKRPDSASAFIALLTAELRCWRWWAKIAVVIGIAVVISTIIIGYRYYPFGWPPNPDSGQASQPTPNPDTAKPTGSDNKIGNGGVDEQAPASQPSENPKTNRQPNVGNSNNDQSSPLQPRPKPTPITDLATKQQLELFKNNWQRSPFVKKLRICYYKQHSEHGKALYLHLQSLTMSDWRLVDKLCYSFDKPTLNRIWKPTPANRSLADQSQPAPGHRNLFMQLTLVDGWQSDVLKYAIDLKQDGEDQHYFPLE